MPGFNDNGTLTWGVRHLAQGIQREACPGPQIGTGFFSFFLGGWLRTCEGVPLGGLYFGNPVFLAITCMGVCWGPLFDTYPYILLGFGASTVALKWAIGRSFNCCKLANEVGSKCTFSTLNRVF